MACLLTANYFIKHHSMALFIHLSTTLAGLNPPSLLSGCLGVQCFSGLLSWDFSVSASATGGVGLGGWGGGSEGAYVWRALCCGREWQIFAHDAGFNDVTTPKAYMVRGLDFK